MPVTSVMARRLIRLSEKPRTLIAQKVGIAASGMAIAATTVARMSRRNRKTTIMVRTAPSYRECIADS